MSDRSSLLLAEARAAVEAQAYALELRDRGKLQWVADDSDCPDVMRLAALAEELGEVARAVHEFDTEQAAFELHQLAGVALAWSAYLTKLHSTADSIP